MKALRAYAWMVLTEAIMGLAAAHYLKMQVTRWMYQTVRLLRW